MKKLFENFRGWVNEQQTANAAAGEASNQKMKLTLGAKSQCSFYDAAEMAEVGFGNELHSFHLTAPIKKGVGGTIAWIGKTFDKKGQVRFYGAAPRKGAQTTGGAQLMKFREFNNKLVLPVGTDFNGAIAAILGNLGLKEGQYEFNSSSPENWESFSLEIASGKKSVNYCKSNTNTDAKSSAKKAPLEADEICNKELIVKVKEKFSKRLPGVPLKHADGEIIISICKIQRMLNNLGLNIEVDGIIGPQTVRALQKAYAELKPTRKRSNVQK